MARVLDTFFVGIGSILIFRSMNYVLGEVILAYSLFFIGIGILLIFGTTRILEKIPFITKPVIRVAAMVFIFIGMGPYIMKYMSEYWYIFLAVGISLVSFGKHLAETIRNGI